MASGKKENALDLAKFVDKSLRVKLAGGREGMLAAAPAPARAVRSRLHHPCHRWVQWSAHSRGTTSFSTWCWTRLVSSCEVSTSSTSCHDLLPA
jgi:hypothetical protein